MLPIYVMWIVVIVLTIMLLVKVAVKKEADTKKLRDLILFLGSFAFLWGMLGQVLGMIQAMGAIERAGDISPAIIAGGFKISLLAPVYGFTLFIISYLVWFVVRRMAKQWQKKLRCETFAPFFFYFLLKRLCNLVYTGITICCLVNCE